MNTELMKKLEFMRNILQSLFFIILILSTIFCILYSFVKSRVNNKKGRLFKVKNTKSYITFSKNKANFKNIKIVVSSFETSKYEILSAWRDEKTNPIQTQNKANSNPIGKEPKMNVNRYNKVSYKNFMPLAGQKNKPKQTQNKFILECRTRGANSRKAKMNLKSLAGKSGHTQEYPKRNSSLRSGLKAIELSSMDNNKLTRRKFLQYSAGSTLALAGFPHLANGNSESKLPPVRAITRGPKFHWFGYYDKLQFDPSGRYALGMEVDFEHRSPKPDDVIKIGMVDLKDNDRWIELGESRSWCWQQGCMLQWLPGSKNKIIWNDRIGDRFMCHILDIHNGMKRMQWTLPHPIYTISPVGRTAVAPDFRRIQDMRPGYGYAGLPDPNKDELAPKDSGIFRINLNTDPSKLTHRQDLIISLADIAKFGQIPGNPKNAKHYFNHLLFNTDGSRFIFLHRWRAKGMRSFGTRMLTAKSDGSDIHIVDSYGQTSHFIWRDPKHILAWAWHPSNNNAFYLYEDGTDKVEVVGKDAMPQNGHCTYLPGNKWILNDTYPDKNRNQNVYLYNVATGKRVPLGSFYLPPQYKGEWRCDTHPRFSPDVRSIVIDSPHLGTGRQMHLIDISKIVGRA